MPNRVPSASASIRSIFALAAPIAFTAFAAFAASSGVSSCAAPAPSGAALRDVAWRGIVCYSARAPIERIRSGRPDPSDPALQAVSVDQAGDVALVHFASGAPRSEVLYRNGAELTGLAIGDVDPRVLGAEIYAGGYARGDAREGSGGAVVQLVVVPGSSPRVRRVYEGDAFVHSLEVVPPQRANDPVRLLASTYAGEIHLLTPRDGDGAWDDRLCYREPPSADPEVPKIKDVGFLVDPSGRAPHRALVALKLGRVLCFDLDRPEATRLIHEETGGVSRVTPDREGGAYVTGYFGRVLHFVPEGEGFRVEIDADEGQQSGLRGLVFGDFPTALGRADRVVFGFHKRCRALVSRLGVFDASTLYVDVDRGHTVEAGDFVPGNGADELLLGGYSNRVTMLVAEPTR
jgi:hypothetical protein